MISFFSSYYRDILKQEFITKYVYKNVYQLPRLEKIVLCLSFSQTSLKSLLPLLSALALISSQKPYLVTLKRPVVLLQIKSGIPTGCRIDIRGKHMFVFLEKFVFSALPRLKEFSLRFRKNILFFSVPNLFIFKEIEKEYEYFSDLPSLKIIFVFKLFIRKQEMLDFLSAFHFPLKKLT